MRQIPPAGKQATYRKYSRSFQELRQPEEETECFSYLLQSEKHGPGKRVTIIKLMYGLFNSV